MDEATCNLLVPDETVEEYLNRCESGYIKIGLSVFDAQARLRSSDVVEVRGKTGSAKTELLYTVR